MKRNMKIKDYFAAKSRKSELEEWREENFEQSKYFCYRCHILRVTLVSDFVTLF